MMRPERWIPTYCSPDYMVSNIGRIYDAEDDFYPALTPDKAGYLRVKMWVNGIRKTLSVHRLVVGSFYDVDISKCEVNHIDGDKQNNFIANLEACDRSYNMLHAFQSGLATPVYKAQKIKIVETGELFDSTGQADRYLKVSSGSVSKTMRGLQPTCRGFTFELVERVM